MRMRTSPGKLTPELRRQEIFQIYKISVKTPESWHGISPKKQELSFLQPGVPNSKPCWHCVHFGDFYFDWIDVWGEMNSDSSFLPSSLSAVLRVCCSCTTDVTWNPLDLWCVKMFAHLTALWTFLFYYPSPVPICWFLAADFFKTTFANNDCMSADKVSDTFLRSSRQIYPITSHRPTFTCVMLYMLKYLAPCSKEICMNFFIYTH